MSKTGHRFKLDDFRDGAVCGVLCLAAVKDQSLLEPVRKWIREGKLVFAPGETDIVGDVLYLADSMPPMPAPEPVKPAAEKPKRTEATRKRAGIKGAGWLSQELVFTDPLVLPRGFRVTEAEQSKTEEWYACRSAAQRIERETGQKPMICNINNILRVIEQRFLTDVKP